MRDEEGTGSLVHLFCMPFSPAHTITKLTIQDPDELDSYLIQIKPIGGARSPVHLFCMPFLPAHTTSKLTIQDQDELDFA